MKKLIATVSLLTVLMGMGACAQPTVTVNYPTPTVNEQCEEDMPCWDCETMGNLICGPLYTNK